MRGEYFPQRLLGTVELELPPRARRIRAQRGPADLHAGTTSACAENTPIASIISEARRNYLRVRGEYRLCMRIPSWLMELPPRARRILGLARLGIVNDGTTSACAENTTGESTEATTRRNYLRVRGEYHKPLCEGTGSAELPPRARRILVFGTWRKPKPGTTSACAENTLR